MVKDSVDDDDDKPDVKISTNGVKKLEFNLSPTEWTIFAVSAIILTYLIGYFGWV
jgi:hypothetical protein